MKFLHIGDVHINKSFATKDESVSKVLKYRLKRSFQNAIEYCLQEKVDALVIAGDLFDHYPIEFEAKVWVLDAFSKLQEADIQVFYASGNHDNTAIDSPLRTMKFPENVHTFFEDQWQVHSLNVDGQSFDFVGCGHIHAHETRPLLESFPKGTYIGVAHTMVASANVRDEKVYLPSDFNHLKSLSYPYFALGHIHLGGPLDLQARVQYSGTLMGLSRKETGLKGGYLVEVDQEGARSDFVHLSALTYDDYDFDMASCSSLEEAFDRLVSDLKRVYKDKTFNKYCLNLYLTGQSILYGTLKDQKTLDQLRDLILEHLDFVDLNVINQTRTIYDLSQYKHGKSVLGAVLFALEDLEKSLDFKAIKMLNTYDEPGLKKLLDHVDEDLMTYFLEGYDEN